VVPQPKRHVPPEQAEKLAKVSGVVRAAYEMRDQAIVEALKAGGGIRAVAEAVGLSPGAVLRVAQAHGWPGDDDRARWQEEKAREWTLSPELAAQLEQFMLGKSEP
jgi:hypothetical protein